MRKILDRFINEKVAIATRTQEEFDDFMELLEKETDLKLSSRAKPTKREYVGLYNKPETVVACNLYDTGRISISHRGYYKEHGYEIVEYQDLIKPLIPHDFIMPKNKVHNPVDKPRHYIGTGGLAVEEILEQFISRIKDGYVAHRVGSAVEYLLRAELKNGREDYEKAKYNINQILEYLDSDWSDDD